MKRMKKSVLACAACLILIAVACIGWNSHAGAASGALLTVEKINYVDSTITLKSTNNDTVAYVSNSSAKKWEEAGTFGSDGTCVFDISWVSLSTNYVITFKGDKSDGTLKVTLPKQVTNFKVKYVPDDETAPFTFTGASDRTIEWRKNGVVEWTDWNPNTTNAQLAYLKENGATLYFRLKPVNGVGTDAGKRASKEVTVKISAKKAAPTVKVDASKFTIPLDAKMSYRVLELDANGNLQGEKTVEWITVGAKRDYTLSELVPSAIYTIGGKNAGTVTKPAAIQFKNNATKSAQESRVATVIIPAQGIVAKDTDGISWDYASSKSIWIEVLGASNPEVSYEYCIVDQDNYVAGSLDYSRVTWTTLSSNKITLNSTTAKEGSHIFIRRKAKGSQGDEKFALASKELELTESVNGLSYPQAMDLKEGKNFAIPAGYLTNSENSKKLEFRAISRYADTKVTSIEFKDKWNKSYGTVECTSESVENESTKDYTIITYITSTARLDSNKEAWNQKLYAHITLSNGEKIESTDDSGITLTLYPPTVVKNPTEADKTNYSDYKLYKTDFVRIYKSNSPKHEKVFKFILELGTQQKYNVSDGAASGELKVDSISYGSFEVFKDQNENNEVIGIEYQNSGTSTRKAVVTVQVDKLEERISTETDVEEAVGKKLPLKICLNNGEILDSDIYLTLEETATFVSEPAWALRKANIEVNPYLEDADKKQSPNANYKEYSFEIKASENLGSYRLEISSVTWGESGPSIYGELAGSDNNYKIILSNAALKSLDPDRRQIVVTFTNGTVIKGGSLQIIE